MVELNLDHAGFFGKVPMRGDFVSFNLDTGFRSAWEQWLNASIAASKQELGEQWLDLFLNAPIWRFILGANICGAEPVAGVFLPNVDKIGRYYPLMLASTLPNCTAPARLFKAADNWFQALEATGLLSLEEPCNFEAFEAAARRVQTPAYNRAESIQLNPVSMHISHGAGIEEAYTAVLDQLTSGDQGAFSLWWSNGSDTIAPTLLCAPHMPKPDQFSAFLDGDWKKRKWQVATPIAPHLPTPALVEDGDGPKPMKSYLKAQGHGATHTGTVRPHNQDSWIALDHLQVYCVADGAGGHDEGNFASQTVTEYLSKVSGATYQDVLRGVAGELHNAHDECLRRARQLGSDRIVATTVTVLVVDDTRYTLIWAGDTRAYQFTQGRMQCLTQDHVDTASGHLTRVIGVGEILDPEIHTGRIQKGDRFLLVSDGIFNALPEHEIEAIVYRKDSTHATRALMEAALIAGARDNITALVVEIAEVPSEGMPVPVSAALV